jgi:TetR/AcrR family transcriptional regulator
MPKDTFFNLSDSKREAITEIAIEEFADHAYGDVSISRIVARAGIAKGSFYQYFDDKEDLFTYLLQLVVERKREMFSLDQPDPQHVGIFAYMRWIAANGVQFERAYPQLSRLAYRAFSGNTMPHAFQASARQQTVAFYRRLVELGVQQGDIDPAISVDLAASIFDLALSSLSQVLMVYIAEYNTDDPLAPPLFDQPGIIQLYNQALDILERGLAPPQAVPETQAAQPSTA